jgi:hypothetical protein
MYIFLKPISIKIAPFSNLLQYYYAYSANASAGNSGSVGLTVFGVSGHAGCCRFANLSERCAVFISRPHLKTKTAGPS